ncbi:MAG TPA: Ldh family oxidoreductase [Anaerolineae bacterium]|nr:Ldh family oxidoreductase [Anaerolineae bacterium]
MQKIKSEVLIEFVAHIFQAAGTPSETARMVAASLVRTNLTGHDSHGVIRVPQYLQSIATGAIQPEAVPVVVRETPTITTIDAQNSFGQVAAQFSMDVTIKKAQQQGVAATTLFRCHHVGRLGEWVELAAIQNMIGLAFCTASNYPGRVAPFGGQQAVLGTNPFAAAVPAAGRPPIVIDFATSIVAEGKVRLAFNQGELLPEGLLLGPDGQPSLNPQDLYEGGALLPFGGSIAGHKGYSLAILMDLLGGILAGRGTPGLPGFISGNGVLFIVLDINVFQPLETFLADIAIFCDYVQSCPPTGDIQQVLMPGEPEFRTTTQRQAEGIPIDDFTWTQLTEVATKLGVPTPTDGG